MPMVAASTFSRPRLTTGRVVECRLSIPLLYQQGLAALPADAYKDPVSTWGRPWRPRPSRLHGPAAGAGRSRSQPCCPDQHRPAPDPTGLGHRAEGAAGSRQQERHRPGRHRPVVQLLRGQPPRRDRRPARGLGPHRCPSAGSAMVLLDGAVAPPTAPQPPPLLLPFLNVEVKPRQQAWAPRQAGAIGSRRSSHPGRPRHSRSTDVGHDLALG